MTESRDQRITRLLDEIVNPPEPLEVSSDELARRILSASGNVSPSTVLPADIARVSALDPDDMTPDELAIRILGQP